MPLLTGTNGPKFSQYTADQYTGNGSQTVYALSRTPPTPASLIVTVDGVKQHSSTYSLGVNQIIFSEAPPNGASVEFVAIGSQGLSITPADDSVTTSKISIAAVTSSRIAPGAITTDKIAPGAINAASMDVNSVGTGAFLVPTGTSSERPASPSGVVQRYNTTNKSLEHYYSGQWISSTPYVSTVGKSKVSFGYTGSGQSWTVPSGVTSIYVKMWGAGGGGGAHSGWSYGAPGGGGGHSRGIIQVSPGQVIAIVVGGGGRAQDGYSAYGGGGIRSTSNNYGSGGGGYTGVFDSSITTGNELMVAGGGGGGGAARASFGNYGGGGGGERGQDGMAPYDGYYSYRGRGGSQTGGGVGGGNSGSKFQGGQATAYGGGGGGGWFGGSGGGYVEDDTMAGGGGGCGYIHPTKVVLGEMFTAAFTTPAYFWDADLQGFSPEHGVSTAMGAWAAGSGAGQGGTGGTGCVVIYY